MTAPTSVDPEALKTIVGAVYPAMLSEPTTVRTRAQSAYTAASATAAALVTAGIVVDLSELATSVQVAGSVAIGLWFLAAALFINISRRVVAIPKGDGDLLTADEFVQKSLQVAVDESAALEKRLLWAACASWAAIAVTAVALLFALVDRPAEPADPVATVALTTGGRASVQAACPAASSPIASTVTGELDLATLESDYAVVRNVEGCGDDHVTLRIRPQQIAAVTVVDAED